MEEELHALVVDRLVGGVDHALQHQVGLLQLIPEEEVGLRELDAHGVVLHHIVRAQHIESAEHPAASRRLLIGNRLLTRLDAEIPVDGHRRRLIVLGQHIDAHSREGVRQGLARCTMLLFLLELLEHLLRDSPVLGLCGGAHQAARQTPNENEILFHTI